MHTSILLALGLAASGVTAIPPPSAVERAAAATVSDRALRAHTKFLSSDLLEGRGPGTRGDQLARSYVASQLEALGLEPAAPGGGWFQPVPLVGIAATAPRTVKFRAASGGREVELRSHDELVLASGVQAPTAELRDAELVFVGYGITAPEQRWDDFKGVDLRGKVIVVLNNDPESSPELFAGKTRLYYGRWTYKYEEAARRGAAGCLIVHTNYSAGYPWQVVQTSWAGRQFELPAAGEPRIQVKAWATEDATRRLFALGGKDLDRLRAAAERRDFRPVPLGVRVSLALTNAVTRAETANVIARLPGSDPKLGGEAVLYTAHHDHLGTKPEGTSGEDHIYNGAVDNASGVAALLTIARAYKTLPSPPRRSIVFAAVAGEEQGLLGSAYLAAHPPIPVGHIAADVNIDGVNIRGRTRDVVYVGHGKSDLDPLVAGLAAAQGRTVVPDQFPEKGSFYRSDQFSLARVGVPGVYLGSGTDVIGKPPGWGRAEQERWIATNYHQPSDEYREDWDLSGAVEDVQLDFLVGLRVANGDAMPSWRPGDEFEIARQRALAEGRHGPGTGSR